MLTKLTYASLILAVAAISTQHVRAEPISLREPINDARTFQVAVKVQAQGTLKTPVKEDTAAELPLDLAATMNYLERRLPAAGRDDRAWRGVRRYASAGSKIVVKEQTTQLQLSSFVKEIVAEGNRSGLLLYSTTTPLQRKDVDLLNLPGDPLTLLAALPSQDVEVGDSWVVPDWAAQMFVGVEAATKTQLNGKLLSVEDQIAMVQLTGEVAGATTGASAKVTLKGIATIDLENKYVSSLKLIQQEERGISTVSPGMTVAATISWNRAPITGDGEISDQTIEDTPFDPPPLAQQLTFNSKYWNLGLLHDRDWHVFQEIPEVAVLRLVKSGSLISQCNIAKLPKMPPGQHVSPDKFERDIRLSLGEQLSQIVDAQPVQTDNGNYIYRVLAAGGSDELEMVWIYYLCAHPDGRQISFVFAAEQSNLETLNSEDLSIVESVAFGPNR